MIDENENLGYISSVDAFEPPKDAPSIDAPDEKALVRLVRTVEKEIELFHTLDGLKRFDMKKFDADEREALCDEVVKFLRGFKAEVNNAIDGIKKVQNG